MGLLVVALSKTLAAPPSLPFLEPHGLVVGSLGRSVDALTTDAFHRRFACGRQLCVYCYADSPRPTVRDGNRLLRALLSPWQLRRSANHSNSSRFARNSRTYRFVSDRGEHAARSVFVRIPHTTATSACRTFLQLLRTQESNKHYSARPGGLHKFFRHHYLARILRRSHELLCANLPTPARTAE